MPRISNRVVVATRRCPRTNPAATLRGPRKGQLLTRQGRKRRLERLLELGSDLGLLLAEDSGLRKHAEGYPAGGGRRDD